MGIDILFNVVAIGAFLVGMAGVALVVTNASRNQSVRGGVILAAVGFLLGLVFMVVGEGLLVVGPTERVVVFNTITGELDEQAREPGLHIIIPGIQQTFPYLVSRQEYTMSSSAGEGSNSRTNIDDAINARSIDGQEVSIDITIIFTIDPENVSTVHRNWSDISQGYIEGLIRPTVRSLTRDVIATARAEEIFGSAVVAADAEGVTPESMIDPETGFSFPNPTPNSRSEVQAEIERLAAIEMGQEGFTVVEVLLNEINFSPDFIQAIENRQVAELDRDRASILAETARIEAGGLADARIEEARGEAEAVRIQAQAEAEALRLVSEQIAANPNLIQYTYINQLSDNVSIVLVPSNSPFLFDASTFTDLDEDFAAPESVPLPNPNDETEESE
jgi:regulator of protease activity HflC (stomatin/prohibitin superfamily)